MNALVAEIIPEERKQSNYIAAENIRSFTNDEAEAMGNELERLYKLGKTSVDEVVISAESGASPFHKHLEWDNEKAAHAHRCEQVRWIVRHINVIVSDDKGHLHEVRAFPTIRLRTDEDASQKREFVPIRVVAGEPDQCAQLIKEAKTMLHGWQRRFVAYRALFPAFDEEFTPVFNALEIIQLGAERSPEV